MEEEKCKCGCGENADEPIFEYEEEISQEENSHNEQETINEEQNDEECCEEQVEESPCECEEECGCEQECCCEESQNYLKDMLRIQAEFDNYRKRMTSALGDARQDGFMDAIVQFLPALDSFKMATDMITDPNPLMGIKFIEKGILDTLSKMGVEEINTEGKFDPEFHQAIDTDESEEYESGDIVKVASKGFIYKDKVIRYSQVIVKK